MDPFRTLLTHGKVDHQSKRRPIPRFLTHQKKLRPQLHLHLTSPPSSKPTQDRGRLAIYEQLQDHLTNQPVRTLTIHHPPQKTPQSGLPSPSSPPQHPPLPSNNHPLTIIIYILNNEHIHHTEADPAITQARHPQVPIVTLSGGAEEGRLRSLAAEGSGEQGAGVQALLRCIGEVRHLIHRKGANVNFFDSKGNTRHMKIISAI